ncbi:MAG: hypothetical protein NT040_13380 [Bacteroidetes bacterium]|nr:hypothetical protein [Bacteroidota bacterium]
MTGKDDKTNQPGRKPNKENSSSLQGYPPYPPGEDIYRKYDEEHDVNPEDISKVKFPNEVESDGKNNEKDFRHDVSGNDLDVPGSELDDDEENIGNEDEENNFYSLGGDGHSDIDEEKE